MPGARTPADPPASRRNDLAKKPQGPSAQTWYSPEGLYRHDRANKMPYFSRIKVKSNYIADYGPWVRLVAAKGNLFDVFHNRTKFDSAKPKLATGARAAVAWVDATSSGVGAAAGSPKPAVAVVKGDKHPYFVIQPFYGSEFVTKGMPRPGSNLYDEMSAQIAVDDGTFKNGRSDLALIRCCEYDGDVEKSVLLRFQKFTFDFAAEASNLAGNVAGQIAWRSNFLANCGSRWSGNDTVNADSMWLLARTGTPTFKVRLMTFVQAYEVATDSLKAGWCHFKIKTVAEDKTSSMSAPGGTGQLRALAGEDTVGRGFAGAHETGHAHGQPDEYPSNSSAYGQKAWGSNHIPGAPFNLDRPAASGMMVGNRAVRPRYAWTLTEWLRNNVPEMNIDFKVEHGAENNYFLPHYPNGSTHPGRAFNFWPVRAYTRYQTPNTVIYDSYLYKCGKEIFTTEVLPEASGGAPVDGILLVLLNVGLAFDDYMALDAQKTRREQFAGRLVSVFENSVNNHVFASCNLGGGVNFSKCYIHFTMRLKEAAADALPADAHLNFLVSPLDAADETRSGDRWIHTLEFADVPPAGNPQWSTEINSVANTAVVAALKRLGLTTDGSATDYRQADAYKTIVRSIGATLNPTMTRV